MKLLTVFSTFSYLQLFSFSFALSIACGMGSFNFFAISVWDKLSVSQINNLFSIGWGWGWGWSWGRAWVWSSLYRKENYKMITFAWSGFKKRGKSERCKEQAPRSQTYSIHNLLSCLLWKSIQTGQQKRPYRWTHFYAALVLMLFFPLRHFVILIFWTKLDIIVWSLII